MNIISGEPKTGNVAYPKNQGVSGEVGKEHMHLPEKSGNGRGRGKRNMVFANISDIEEIMTLYKRVVETVNKTTIKLGWNTETYPDEVFIKTAIEAHEMVILRDEDRIIAAGVVNHNMNKEYDDIDWMVKGPRDKISTIHALATDPDHRGKKTSDQFLSELEAYCKESGDLAIHLDVIDTNIPAYKLYLRNGYTEAACVKMYYEVVGTREFWMMEKVL